MISNKQFLLFLKERCNCNSNDVILLTVSGGIDSVVMCDLFFKNKLSFAIAHCNFKLRGEDSDKDQAFVETLAMQFNVRFHTKDFNATEYAENNNISIQMAAREQRYHWFDEVLKQNNYQYIATAHHLDDVAETLLINLTKGCGIAGLHGISAKRDNIIRPLLFTDRESILQYAQVNNIKHREDITNAGTKYIRNKIRHLVLPVLKEINPSLLKTIETEISYFAQIENLVKDSVEIIKGKIVKENTNYIEIDVLQLLQYNHTELYLYEILKEYNFQHTEIKAIANNISKTESTNYYSETHTAGLSRGKLYISMKTQMQNQTILINSDTSILQIENKILSIEVIEVLQNIEKDNSVGLFDFDKILFPLCIRKWKEGDKFIPLGMNGFKNVSDFLTDIKLNPIDKSNQLVLCQADDIVWILGRRIDNRFKTSVGKKTLKIKI